MHPILQRQQLGYQIFVVEQAGNDAFNRAALMNVGYAEASERAAFDCFVFHDVDLVPEVDRQDNVKVKSHIAPRRMAFNYSAIKELVL